MDRGTGRTGAGMTVRRDIAALPRRACLRLPLLLPLAAGPALAQSAARPPRIGFIGWYTADAAVRFVEPFRRGMREFNYVEGRNVEVEYHWADASAERAAALARDLVSRQMDLIIVWATPAAHAVKNATQSIPVVMTVADPLATGLVSNLTRPGGNITGFGSASTELSGKRLELLAELLPGLRKVAFLGSTQDPNAHTFVRETVASGATRGIEIQKLLVDGPDGFDGAFAEMVRGRAAAVVVQPIFIDQRARVTALALKHRLPAVSDHREFAQSGGLLAYGASSQEQFRRIAYFVDRILKGARPGDLPIEQPTEFELLVNQRTARALGLAIPPAVLARADEVIE
jgi:putative ABC transport system substrate-binding protein